MTRHPVWSDKERTFHANLIAERDRLAANDRKPSFDLEQRRIERELREWDPYGQLGPRDTVYDDELRDLAVFWWQRRIKAFCIAVAVFAIVYFGGRELLAVVS